MIVDGKWISPPPTWECIRGEKSDSDNNIDDYINITEVNENKGVLYNRVEFIVWCEL